jgi:hypothetical protein
MGRREERKADEVTRNGSNRLNHRQGSRRKDQGSCEEELMEKQRTTWREMHKMHAYVIVPHVVRTVCSATLVPCVVRGMCMIMPVPCVVRMVCKCDAHVNGGIASAQDTTDVHVSTSTIRGAGIGMHMSSSSSSSGVRPNRRLVQACCERSNLLQHPNTIQ